MKGNIVKKDQKDIATALNRAAESLEQGEELDIEFLTSEAGFTYKAAILLQNFQISSEDKASVLRVCCQYTHRPINDALVRHLVLRSWPSAEDVHTPSGRSSVLERGTTQTPTDSEFHILHPGIKGTHTASHTSNAASVFAVLFGLASAIFWVLTAIALSGAFNEEEIAGATQQQVRMQEATLYGIVAGFSMLCCVLLAIYNDYKKNREPSRS